MKKIWAILLMNILIINFNSFMVEAAVGNAQVTSGYGSAAVVTEDGTLYFIGKNITGSTWGGGAPVCYETPVAVSGGTNVKRVDLGYEHGVVLKTDGRVYSWGRNRNYQLGTGGGTTSYSPGLTSVRGGETGATYLTGIKDVAAGSNFSVALKEDGTVFAWGNNDSGQLGDGTKISRSTPVKVRGGETGDTYLTGVKEISADGSRVIVLKEDGSVYSWGYNTWKGVGDGTNTDRTTPVRVKGGDAGGTYLSNVKRVIVSGERSVALLNNGTTYWWGMGKYQSVGGGGGGSAGPSVPTKIRATNTGNTHFTNVEKIEAQGYQVIFRKTDGTIYGMGLNGYGQLGIGATSAVTEPIRLEAGESGVGYLDSFVSMGASESDMYLLLNDGYVYAAGRNQYGSHGTGGRVATASLVKVHGGAAGGTYLRLFNPNAAPTAPTVTAPTNGIKTSDNTVTVNWNFNDPDSGDTQSKYRVQGSTNNFSTIHYESGTISSSAKTITTTALADGNWKFRIMTWDSKNVASPWSSHRSFMVDTTAPTLTYGYTSGARYVNGKDYWVRTNDTINFWVQGVDTLAGTRRVFLLAREGSSNSYRLHYNNNTGQNYNNHDKFSFQNSIQNISNATTLKATFPINIKAGNGVVAEIEAISDDLASPHNRTGGTWVDNGLRLKVDGEIPTGPTINVDSSWQNTNVNFTVTGGSDTGSGVARREYKIGSGAWTTYSSAVTVSTEGITTVYARTVDNVGHVSAQVSREVKIDKTKPTATFTPNNKADWTKEIIGVTYTPSDNLSGVKVYKEAYSYNGGSTYSGWYPEETGVSSSTLSAEGHRKIKIYIEDNAGNSNIVYSGDYYVDTTVPTYVSSSIVGARYTNGNDYWVRPGDSAQFKLRANDNLSGPKNMYVVIDSLDANAAVHDLYGAVGNNNEWYTSALTSLTNPVRSYSSGNIKEVTWTLTGKAEMPLQNMKYYFSDRADNGISKTTLPLRFGVDNTKPTVPTINVDSSWQNTNVNFTITGGTDSGSGLARREYKIGSGAWQAYSSAVTVSAEGITTVYARTVDNVGNISAQVSREVKIDKTKPTDPVISVNQNWSNTDENFTVTSGIDALSGVLNTEYRIEGQDDWTLYSAPVTISKQNVTKIFLRTTDNARNVSETSMFMKNDDGFESDLDPSFWKWASVDENLTTMVRDNVVKKNGAYSLKMTNTHSIAQDVCVTNNIKPDNGVLVSSGDIYKVSYWVKGQSGKRSYFRIWWYDGSYTAINKISEVVKDLSSNEWTRVEALITVPAGARKMGFDLFQLATEPGASFYIDDLNVSKVMAETKIDKGMPTSISVDTIAVDMNGYEVELKGALDSMSGINRVQFPSWTSANGQDDLLVDWNTNPLVRGTDMGSGTYRFRVDIADHGNERGQYYTHIYIYDNAGNKYFAGGATPYVNSEPVVTMSTDKAAYLKGETGKLNISISDVDVADTIDYSLSAGVYAVMLGRTSGVGKGSVEIDIDTSKFDINEFVWNGTRYEKDVQIDLSVTDHKGGLVNKAVTIKIYNNKPVVTQDTPLSKLKPFTHMDISGKVLDDSGETLIGKYFFYSPLDSSKKTAERFIKGFVSTGQEGYFDARIDYDKAYLDTIKDYLGGRDSEELTDVNLRLIVRDSNGGEGYSDKLMKVKYNIVPDITVTDNLVYKKEGEVLSLSGTIIDADMDNMIIKGTIGGVEKTNTRVGAGAYTLSWNTSELLEGTYTGFKISVDDQMGGSDDVTYTSNIVVDKRKPIGSFTPNSQGAWGKVDVAFRVDSSDNGPAGLEGANCQIRHSLDEGSTWTSWSGLTVPLYNGSLSPSDGKRMIEIKLVDKSGNENIIRSGVYLIDKTNPVLSIDSTEQGYDYIRADISAIDTLSGVKDYRVDLGSDIGSYGSDTSKNFADLKSNKRYTLKAYVRDNVDNIHSLTRNITTYAVVPQIDVIDTEDNKVTVRVYTDDRNDVRPEVKIICINKADSSDTVEVAFTDKEIITVEGLTPAVNYKVDAVVKNIAGHEERKNVLDNIMFASNDNDPVIHSFEVNYGNATTTQSEIDMKLVASDDKTFEKDLKVQFDINGRKYGYDSDGSVWKENHFGDYQTYYGGFKLDGIGENRITATIVDEGSNKARLTKLVTYQTNTSKPVIVEKPIDTGSEVSDILYDEDGRILTRERLVKIEYSSSGDEFAVSKDSVVWSPWEKVKDSTILKYVELDEKVGIVKTVYVRVRDEAKAEGDIKVIYYLLDREGPEVNITTSNNIRIAKDGKVTLKLEAKDNVSKDLSYKITVKSESSEKVIEGKTKGLTSILEPISGLSAGSYSVEVVVKDQLGNEGKASMNLWSK